MSISENQELIEAMDAFIASKGLEEFVKSSGDDLRDKLTKLIWSGGFNPPVVLGREMTALEQEMLLLHNDACDAHDASEYG